ncbi:hypothetical protein [Fibrobacter succinogenes]|uniref:hypothetical protein n=1 Tax=Fibrobacter succinogenes TaxID=833 RepID=UPI00156A369C|nr:hypothetical protein [Fibrobacter succinogenes]
MPFSQEYLKDYEAKIRQLPLEELYDILSLIRDDPFKADDSPERVKIVEKRIKELCDNPNCLLTDSKLNDKLETEYQKTPHPKSFILKLLGFILLIPIFFPYTRNGDPCIDFRSFIGGVSILLFMIASLMDKRIVIRGEIIHKDAHPLSYNFCIATFFVASVFCFYCGLFPKN